MCPRGEARHVCVCLLIYVLNLIAWLESLPLPRRALTPTPLLGAAAKLQVLLAWCRAAASKAAAPPGPAPVAGADRYTVRFDAGAG